MSYRIQARYDFRVCNPNAEIAFLPEGDFELSILPDDRDLLDEVYSRIGHKTTCHDTPSVVYRVREIQVDKVKPVRTWFPVDPPE